MITKQELLRVLKNELEFLEKSGYADFEKKSWRPAMLFEDSPTCPNRGLSQRLTPCDQCALIRVIPIGKRNKQTPCRDIPLNAQGETLQSLYQTATRDEVEWKFDQWLRQTIDRLERETKEETFRVKSETSLKVSRA